MKPSEMELIYNEACRTASNRPVPEAAQLKIWRAIMGGFDPNDLRGGLEIWWRTEKFLPMPAELKPLAEQARRVSAAKLEVKKDFVTWMCPVCRCTRCGWPDDPDLQRYCMNYRPEGIGRCGAILQIVVRETAAQYGNSSGSRA